METKQTSRSIEHSRFPLLARGLGDEDELGYHPETNRLLSRIVTLLLTATILVHLSLQFLWHTALPGWTQVVAFPPFYGILLATLILLHHRKTWIGAKVLIFGIAIAQVALMFAGVGLASFVLISLLNTVLLTGVVLGTKPAFFATIFVLGSVISFKMVDRIYPLEERSNTIHVIEEMLFIPDLATMGFTAVIVYLTINQFRHLYETLIHQQNTEELALEKLQAVQNQNAQNALFGDALSSISGIVTAAKNLEDITPHIRKTIEQAIVFRLFAMLRFDGEKATILDWNCSEFSHIKSMEDLEAFIEVSEGHSISTKLIPASPGASEVSMNDESYEPSFLSHLGFPQKDCYSFNLGGPSRARGVIIIVMPEGETMTQDIRSFLSTLTSMLRARISHWDWGKNIAEAQKLEAVGILGGRVAHDFNNLLTSMGGNTELLMHTTQPDSPTQPHLHAISHAISEAAVITRKLLSFTRKSDKAPQEIELNTAIREFIPLILATLPKDVRLQLALCQQPLNVFVNLQDFENVVSNLILNARDAIAGDGVIEVRSSLVKTSDVNHSLMARIVVRDNGVGMNEHVQSHAFLPFFTTKSEHQNSGLGLPIVYGTIKRNGGQIAIDSAANVGTTITLDFPSSSSMTPSERTGKSQVVPTNQPKVLTIVLEAQVEFALKELLQELGYEWTGVQNVADAKATLGSQPDIEIIMMDADMQKNTANEMITWIDTQKMQTAVVLMSSWDDPKSFSGTPFIRKPISLEALSKALESAALSRNNSSSPSFPHESSESEEKHGA